MFNKNLLNSVFLISLMFCVQGCYLFFLFKPDKTLEGIVEQFIEEKILDDSESKRTTIK